MGTARSVIMGRMEGRRLTTTSATATVPEILTHTIGIGPRNRPVNRDVQFVLAKLLFDSVEEDRMKRIDGLSVGWLDASIGALAHNDATPLSRFAFLLITSIDSNPNLQGIPAAQQIVEIYPDCAFLDAGLIVPGAVLKGISERFSLFTGFDEAWCFDEEPEVGKPVDLTIVSPLNLGEDDPPQGLAAWMDTSRCKLGLGDGIGLNFATPNEEIARTLQQLVLA